MEVRYCFAPPDKTPEAVLDQISDLVASGGGVGTSTHKYPKERYLKKIEVETGLDLSGYLERGYTAVDPEFRNQGIGLKVIQGLIEKSGAQKIYVTIDMNNPWPLRMTHRVGMVLAARFINDRTGHELGVFTNVTPCCLKASLSK